ncbi:L,D-transpeptidase family protein [Aliiroseovarius crassostreae]|uniref:L,D-transpeptidase family protein n=1 Tax=Aliiroseovarius crassostreae TaxID=154981 RepID=UPI0021AFA6D0|nr:L,D-transpeptidase family protein [Aliiroseovarius crassostreae]UWQ09605.1 L,D-transpeptidase family protein [Aliiroseovarius crassostreae]
MLVTRWGARFMGRSIPCSIGRGGMTDDKREGDGATPRGIWELAAGLYRADRRARPTCPLPLRPIGPWDLWSDDPDDPNYNHPVRALRYSHSHEQLRMAAPLYDVCLISDQNWPDAVPGKGSALFVHNWRRPRFPTAGCIAFAANDLNWILARWQADSRILVR